MYISYNPQNDFIQHNKFQSPIPLLPQISSPPCSLTYIMVDSPVPNKNAYQLFEIYSSDLNGYKINLLRVQLRFSTLRQEEKESDKEKEKEKEEIESATKNVVNVLFDEDIQKSQILLLFFKSKINTPNDCFYRPGEAFLKNKLEQNSEIFNESKFMDISEKKYGKAFLSFYIEDKELTVEKLIEILSNNKQSKKSVFKQYMPSAYQKYINLNYMRDFGVKKNVIESNIDNFQFGLLEKMKKKMGVLWDIDHIDKTYGVKVNRQRLIIKKVKGESAPRFYIIAFLRMVAQGDKIKTRTWTFKFEFKTKEVFVEKNSEDKSMDFFFLLEKEYPLCSYREIEILDFKTYLDEKTFIRCPNLLINKELMDFIELSHLRKNGCFLIHFSEEQVKSNGFLDVCKFLQQENYINKYNNGKIFSCNDYKILKKGFTMSYSKFNDIKEKTLQTFAKYYLLALDSRDKIDLIYIQEGELENLGALNDEKKLIDVFEHLLFDPNPSKLTIAEIIKRYDDLNDKILTQQTVLFDPNQNQELIRLRKLLVTPSCIYFQFHDQLFPFRNLEKYRKNYNSFLLIKFVDENFGLNSNQTLINWTENREFIQSKLIFLRERYYFLGYSNKLLGKKTFLAAAKFNSKIEKFLFGNLDTEGEEVKFAEASQKKKEPKHLYCLPHYCQRVSNCLDQGLMFNEILGEKISDSILFDITDNQDERELGVSQDILLEIAQFFNNEFLSAVEVNFFGHHKLLVYNEEIKNFTIRINRNFYEKIIKEIFYNNTDKLQSSSSNISVLSSKLEKKEESKSRIEVDETETKSALKAGLIIIIAISELEPGFLDYNKIFMLSELNNANTFLKLEKELLNTIEQNFIKKRIMLKYYFSYYKNRIKFLMNFKNLNYKPFQFYSFIDILNKNNINMENDAFFEMMNETYYNVLYNKLLRHGNHLFLKNIYLFFCIRDPYGVLKEDEIFLQIYNQENQTAKILEGNAIIMRTHEIDINDLRIKKLSSHSRLKQYYNVIVYSDLKNEKNEHDSGQLEFEILKNPYRSDNKFLFLHDPDLEFKKEVGVLRKIFPNEIYENFPVKDNEKLKITLAIDFFIHVIENQKAKQFKYMYEAYEEFMSHKRFSVIIIFTNNRIFYSFL